VSSIYNFIADVFNEHMIVRFWGWSENAREEQLDFKELSARAAAGKPLYG
jgi:hypothetical protein